MTPEEIKVLQDKLDASEKELASAKKLNDSLKQEIISKEKATAPAATAVSTSLLPDKPFKLDDKSWKVIYPSIIHKGKEVTAHQIVKDPAIQKELVEMNSGALVEA